MTSLHNVPTNFESRLEHRLFSVMVFMILSSPFRHMLKGLFIHYSAENVLTIQHVLSIINALYINIGRTGQRLSSSKMSCSFLRRGRKIAKSDY
jgi:hypothetical protein